jgi:hypothetical protein
MGLIFARVARRLAMWGVLIGASSATDAGVAGQVIAGGFASLDLGDRSGAQGI